MSLTAFPEPKDLHLEFKDMVLDGKNISVAKYDVSNPHPGFGKDPNILNEYGHTKYPMFVGTVIVNNEEEELAARGEAAPIAEAWNLAPPELLQDGPTVAEYVAAGYKAFKYPPAGYAAKSTQEEIDAAIAAESAEPKGWT